MRPEWGARERAGFTARIGRVCGPPSDAVIACVRPTAKPELSEVKRCVFLAALEDLLCTQSFVPAASSIGLHPEMY